MKKIVLLVFACLLVASSVQAEKEKEPAKAKQTAKVKKPKKVKMKNQVDTVSYSIGVAIGNDLKKQLTQSMGDNKNIKLILDGLSSSIIGDTTAIPVLKADTIVENYMKAAFAKKEKKRLDDNANFLKENSKKPGVVTLPSGLQYLVEKEGTGARPADSSTVKVHYEGTLIDGTVFDSSIKRGQPITFALNKVIKGWTEGVQHMTVGSKYKLFIPAELGYGAQQAGPIPPNSTLIFEVELLDIIKPEAPEAPTMNNTKPAETPNQKASTGKTVGKTHK